MNRTPVKVYFTRDELKLIRAHAGLPVSSYLRRLALGDVKRHRGRKGFYQALKEIGERMLKERLDAAARRIEELTERSIARIGQTADGSQEDRKDERQRA